jgi:hypothetical protein
MVRRRISEAQRWQTIGMHTTGMSFKASGCQMGYHYTVVIRLVRKHTQTNNVKDLPRSGRPQVTSGRDDRPLQRLVRRMPFASSPVLKQHWRGQQLVARRLWCTDNQLGCFVWWLNPACSHERYTPKPLLSLPRKGQLAGCSLGYMLYLCVSKPSSGRRLHDAETGSRLTHGSCAMSLKAWNAP